MKPQLLFLGALLSFAALLSCGGRSQADFSLPVGQVTATDNPQVALYTMTLPFPGSVTVNFGTGTNCGLKTWTQSTETAGGEVSIFVAGMQASTTYHMQAAMDFSNGITVNDTDHIFTTKALPANMQLNVTTTITSGMTPQSGLELLNPLAGTPTGVIVTDLSGNVLWAYSDPDFVRSTSRETQFAKFQSTNVNQSWPPPAAPSVMSRWIPSTMTSNLYPMAIGWHWRTRRWCCPAPAHLL